MLGMAWKFYRVWQKSDLKLKAKKFLGLIPTFAEVPGGKLVVISMTDNLKRSWTRRLTANVNLFTSLHFRQAGE